MSEVTRTMGFDGQRRVFSGYHYRTSSRFGGPVEIVVADDWLTVSGRRVSKRARDAWTWAQGGLMLWSVAALLDVVFSGDRRARRRLYVSMVIQYLVAAFGALSIWWPADLGREGLIWRLLPDGSRGRAERRAEQSFSAVGFPCRAVSNVRVTPNYSRHGLWFISWPWQLAVLPFTTPRQSEVVFDVEDPAHPGHVLVFAINAGDRETAEQLAEVLRCG